MSLRREFSMIQSRHGRVGAVMAQSFRPQLHLQGPAQNSALLQAFSRTIASPAAVASILDRKVGVAQVADLPKKYLAFNTGSTAASTAATQQTPAPNATVQVSEFAIDDINSTFFTIETYKIGQQDQLLNGVAIPATFFSTKGTKTSIIGAPTLSPSVPITFGCTNQDLSAHTLRGAWTCVQLDGDC